MPSTGQSGGYEGGRARLTWSSRPRHGWDDLVTLMWRQRLMIVVIFAVLFALGALAALMLPKTYTAYSSLLVQMTQEYV